VSLAVSPHHEALCRLVAREIDREATPEVKALAAELRRRHGAPVAGVLFYGSILRARAKGEGVYDLYVLVDDYRRAYLGSPGPGGRPRGRLRSALLAAANRALPPNVFYLELPYEGRTLRAKYAMLSLDDFRRATLPTHLHTLVWARFSQPFLLLDARDAEARRVVIAGAAQAIVTLVGRLLPLLRAVRRGRSFVPREFWQRAFRETYAAEFRTESPDTVERIYESARSRFDEALCEGLGALGDQGRLEAEPAEPGRVRVRIDPTRRRAVRRAWRVQRPVAKALAGANLIKSAVTFGDWLPYALWKLRRHTGVVIEPTPLQRRHPLIFGWPVILHLIRRRDLR
jgi:hypothetical protein